MPKSRNNDKPNSSENRRNEGGVFGQSNMNEQENRDISFNKSSNDSRIINSYSDAQANKKRNLSSFEENNVYVPKPFKLEISDEIFLSTDEILGDDEPQPEVSNGKGGIYFSNQPPRNSQIDLPVSAKLKNIDEKTPKKKKEKKKIMPPVMTAIAAFGIILVVSTLIAMFGISCINDVVATNRSDMPIEITIPEGQTTSQVLKVLSENDLIKRRLFCTVFVDFMAKMKKQKKEPVYLGGVYHLEPSMGVEGMLNELKVKKNTDQTIKLSFPEGWTIYQIFKKIDEYGVCKADYLYSSIENVQDTSGFLKDTLSKPNKYLSLEGYMYPDTYEFYIGENANSVIKRFIDNSKQKWTDEYVTKAKKLNRSMDEILIIASIIQKEAANKEQMSLVSSVIYNRLNDPVNYPDLRCDSTYDYLSNAVSPRLGATVAATYANYYNTYRCTGLPAGPICNPGKDAIEAALNPKETNYMFFRHDKNGKIYMAKNVSEHDANGQEVNIANSTIS